MLAEPQRIIAAFLAGAAEVVRAYRIIRIEVKIPEFHDISPL
jgi:hypothetical protein